MPVLLYHPKRVIHIPMKTGSTWLRAMLRENEIEHSLYYGSMAKAGFERILHNAQGTHHLATVPPGWEDVPAAVTLRHPVDWYVSYWLHYRNINNPEVAFGQYEFHVKINRDAMDDFGEFVRQTKKAYPRGLLWSYFMQYIERSKMVWRLDTIYDDLCNYFGKTLHRIRPRNTAMESFMPSVKERADILEYESGYYELWRYNEGKK